MAGENPLSDPMGHTLDSDYIHLPGGSSFNLHDWTGKFLGGLLEWAGITGLTKFMLLELIAFILLLVVLIPMAARLRRLGYPKGLFVNAVEAICIFIRDNAVVPAIGEKDAPKFLPYLWSVFFFILVNNLFGLIPWMGSATAGLGCTTALALCSLVLIHGSGLVANGPVKYAKSIVPPVPIALYPLMLFIELLGHVIRPCVLAFRLFVNMTAGHTLLFVLMCFIALTGPSLLNLVITPLSILGVVAFSVLEILVAFLQAYVFTFLSAIFIGAAVHPHH